MDTPTGSISIWPLIGIGLCAAVVAWEVAKRKSRDRRLWAGMCFLFAPALIMLAFLRAKQQPGASEADRPRRSSWWWRAPVGLFGLWLLVSLLWSGGSSGFPTCEASTTRELVRQAIENANDRSQVHRRLLALDQIRELAPDPKTLNRFCVGEAVLNSGERQIVWRLYARDNSIFVSVSGF